MTSRRKQKKREAAVGREAAGHAPAGSAAKVVEKKGIFGSRAVSVWTVLAGVIGLVSLIVAVKAAIPDTKPELGIKIFDVHDPGPIDADFIDTATGEKELKKLDANTIDIVVSNTGKQAALISKIEAEVLYAKEMANCIRQGGGLQIAAHYQFVVPEEVPNLPHRMSKDTTFQVESAKNDRFAVTIGPEKQWPTAVWLYVVKISVVYDGDSSPVAAGTAAVLASSSVRAKDHLDRAIETGDYECLDKNVEYLGEAFAIPAKRSAELESLRSQADELAKSYAAVNAPPACVPRAEKATMQACLYYSRRELKATFVLPKAVTTGTRVMFKINPKGSSESYRWASMFERDWTVGFLEVDDPSSLMRSAHGCGPCSISGNSTEVTMTVAPDTKFNFESLTATVELQKINKVRDVQSVSLVEGPIEVVRAN